MGNPFINTVYIGHPVWKAMGGRIGYSAATGLMVILLAWFRYHRGVACVQTGGGDLADPTLYRHADRRAGPPDDADTTRARRRPCADAPPCGVVQWTARSAPQAPAQRPSAWKNSALPAYFIGPRSAGWWLDPYEPRAGRDWGLRHRAQVHRSFGIRGSRCRADLLRLHAWESIGIAVTATVAVAYVILAAFLYGLARYPELVPVEIAPAKEAVAHPAE
jgi:hypothetical protein